MRHDDLEVWKRGYAFALTVYKVTKDFPREEIYGITSQLRRAALSIPLNIAEGSARSTNKDFLHFLCIAEGSIAECSTLLKISSDLTYLPAASVEALLAELMSIHRMTAGLAKAIRGKS
ncbi:MAG: four helix bundle protein [Elusimicrobia bacterium]|nr:four helix bundle protein [Elusimicrobiota bacterium]